MIALSPGYPHHLLLINGQNIDIHITMCVELKVKFFLDMKQFIKWLGYYTTS